MVGRALDHQFDHRAIEEKRLETDLRDVWATRLPGPSTPTGAAVRTTAPWPSPMMGEGI